MLASVQYCMYDFMVVLNSGDRPLKVLGPYLQLFMIHCHPVMVTQF